MKHLPSFGLLLTLCSLFAVVSLSGADLKYLGDAAPVAVRLLPPPPEASGVEAAADLATVKAAIAARTPEQEAFFREGVELNVFSFSTVLGPWFSAERLPKTAAFFIEVEKETRAVTNAGKNFWKRSRPYTVDTSIRPIVPEKSFSYPSGHSTRATVFSFILAELFPLQKDAVLAHGRMHCWIRVVGGVHYPTDIYGGRVLGQALAQRFLESAAFRKELAEVRAEIEKESPKAP